TDLNASAANNSSKLCDPTGTKDDKGNDTFPIRCSATLNFPRFALSDGQRLFIADGGNNRVLVYNSIPTKHGARADVILGQPDEQASELSESTAVAASDTLRTPVSLAWHGIN